MESTNSKVFKVDCPCCRSVLWIDAFAQSVIKFDKPKKKKGSLDDLLLKEKKKKEEADRKFESTAEMAMKKKQEAQDKFASAFSKMKKTDK